MVLLFSQHYPWLLHFRQGLASKFLIINTAAIVNYFRWTAILVFAHRQRPFSPIVFCLRTGRPDLRLARADSPTCRRHSPDRPRPAHRRRGRRRPRPVLPRSEPDRMVAGAVRSVGRHAALPCGRRPERRKRAADGGRTSDSADVSADERSVAVSTLFIHGYFR